MAYTDRAEEPTRKVDQLSVPNVRELMEIAKAAALAELRAQRERHNDLWEIRERPVRQR